MTEPGAGEVTLAAVMFLDMVGYSALMQADEARALRAVRVLEDILRNTVPAMGGKLVKFMGDGSMTSFQSAEAAVSCGLELQERVAAHNASASPSERFRVRIGIHLGEVTEKENDLFGDAVNIAARIQPIADPGGMALSTAVLAQVVGIIRLRGTMRRRVRLKNIAERANVFLVAPLRGWYWAWYVRKHRLLSAAAVIACLAGLAWTGWKLVSAPIAVPLADWGNQQSFWTYSIGQCQGRMDFTGETGKKVLKVKVGCDNAVWGVGTACTGTSKGDWRGYSGLRFRIRGDLTPLILDIYERAAEGSADGGEIWRGIIPLTAEWADVDIPFWSLRKRGDFQSVKQDNNGLFNSERLLNMMVEVSRRKGSYEIAGIWLLKPRFAFVARLSGNRPPGAPVQPVGPTTVALLGRCRYAVVAEDRDGDRMTMRVDWGDGTYSLTADTGSGQAVTTTHAWTALGAYQVRAQAIDTRGNQSPWSSPLAVVVGGAGPLVIDEYETTRMWEVYASGPISLARSDTGEGAALRIAYGDIGGPNGYWIVLHHVDAFEGALAGFRGLSFRVRADKPVNLGMQVQETGITEGEGEGWDYRFDAKPEWTSVIVPFERMEKAGYQVKGQDNNGRFDLDVIGQFRFYSVGYQQSGATVYIGPISLVRKQDPGPVRVVAAGITRPGEEDETGSVFMSFSGHLDKGSAGDLGNYRIKPEMKVLSASLWKDGCTVELVTEKPFEVGSAHSLVVRGIRDSIGNPVEPGAPVNLVPVGDGLAARCYPSVDFSGESAGKTDRVLVFKQEFEQVYPGIPMTSMSVKWDGWLKAEEAGEYTFVMKSDDGARLVVDGQAVIDDWKESGESRRIGRVRFAAGSWHRIEVQHFNAGGVTSMDLRWSHGGNPPTILSPLNLFTKKPVAEKPAAQKPGK